MAKLAIALLAWCGLAQAHAEMRLMTPDQAQQFDARLRGWASSYYSALLAEKRLPEGMVLGFIVDKSGTVVEHTVGLKAEDGTTIAHHLAHLFPHFQESELQSAGGGCFGMKPGEPRYCVEYATLPN